MKLQPKHHVTAAAAGTAMALLFAGPGTLRVLRQAAEPIERLTSMPLPLVIMAGCLGIGLLALQAFLMTWLFSLARRAHARIPARSARRFWLLVCAVGFLAMLLGAGAAHAAEGPITPDQLIGAANNGGNDASMKAFVAVLGDFAQHPLTTLGGSSTVLGSMFVIFNGAIFCISVLWGSYGIGRGILTSAQEGQVLGQRMSAVWMPIRMVTGLVGSVPIFGGYNGFQVLVVLAATLGIGMANLMWSGAISSISKFQGLLTPPIGQVFTASRFDEPAKALFRVQVCRLAKAAEEQRSDVVSPASAIQPIASTAPGSLGSIGFGTVLQPDLCGRVQLVLSGSRSSSSALSFRVASVNYEGITSASSKAHADAFKALDAQVVVLAREWLEARSAWQAGSLASPPAVPLDKLSAAAVAAADGVRTAVQSAAQDTGAQVLAADAQAAMRRNGWSAAGAWYSTFAEASAALREAGNAVTFDIQLPSTMLPSGFTAESLVALDKAFAAGEKASPVQASQGGEGDKGWRAVKLKLCQYLHVDTPTGNCSLGQSLVSAVVGQAGDSTGVIDPVISFKNMGDWMMAAGEGLGVAVAYLKGAENTIYGRAAEAAADLMPPVGVVGASVATAKGALGMALETLPGVAFAMVCLGTIMAVYLPMLPALTWLGALVQYFVVVIEGLVAAGIAALAHMEAEGEGMGQRTERFYIFLLIALARPALMLLGFFMAAALSTVLGTFFAKTLFLPAMANAQGNSITGLVSVIGYVLVFMLGLWTLVSGLFAMTHLLPDQVLGYMGAGHTSELGKSTESGARSVFITSVQRAGQRLGLGLGGGDRGKGRAGKGGRPGTGKDSQE